MCATTSSRGSVRYSPPAGEGSSKRCSMKRRMSKPGSPRRCAYSAAMEAGAAEGTASTIDLGSGSARWASANSGP